LKRLKALATALGWFNLHWALIWPVYCGGTGDIVVFRTGYSSFAGYFTVTLAPILHFIFFLNLNIFIPY